jgi:hypothetical protein
MDGTGRRTWVQDDQKVWPTSPHAVATLRAQAPGYSQRPAVSTLTLRRRRFRRHLPAIDDAQIARQQTLASHERTRFGLPCPFLSGPPSLGPPRAPGPDELLYDVGFLVWGGVMLAAGTFLPRTELPRRAGN